MNKATKGFTIVELLIVVVVIAILAAVTIVSYQGIANRAHDSTVKNDLRSFQKKADIFKVHNDRYPKWSELAQLEMKVSKPAYAVGPATQHNFMYCVDFIVGSFAIVAESKSGTAVTSSNGLVAYTGEIIGDYEQPDPNQHACKALLPGWNLNTVGYENYTGYNSTNTTDGPWKAWVGGN